MEPPHGVVAPYRPRKPRTRYGRRQVVASLILGGAIAAIAIATSGPDAAVGKATRMLRSFDTSDLQIPAGHIKAGGPPKDSIPSLSDPDTVAVDRADFLDASDRVVGVTIGEASRAYPIAILNWHEIINDTLGSVPIAVIYCPLCDSVSVIDRRVGGETLTFGVSGLLYNSNVLLFDRKSDALWSQVGQTAISGEHVGEAPKHLTFELVRFARWSNDHPDSDVVSTRTGHRRDYDRSPYGDYSTSARIWFPLTRRDRRVAAKQRVVGVQHGGVVKALPLSQLRKLEDRRLEVKLRPDDAKPLILHATARADEVRLLSLPDGARAVHTFWFAWASIHPKTEIFRACEPSPSITKKCDA